MKISDEVQDLKTQVALIKQSNETICKKVDLINEKLDKIRNVDEIHERLTETFSELTKSLKPVEKTTLEKIGAFATNIKNIAMAIIFLIVVLAILLKVDWSNLIK